MTSQTFTLTQTPVQILDGTKAAYIQEMRGEYTRFASSTTAPNPTTTPLSCLPSLEFLYERLMLDGNAQENWQSALNELSLTLVVTEEQDAFC